jgi:Zn-dependent protease
MKALLLLLSFGKLGKVALSAGSMLLSLGTYALLFGWRYAAGFIAMLLVHEMGHYLAARQRGLDVGLPTFLPFVGAWIALKEQPMDADTEAYVGISGPILGSGAAFACYLYAEHTQEPVFMAVAYAGFMLNLFNLTPLSPLDGGRIMAAISPKLWLLGLPLLVGLFFWHPSPMIVVIGIMALPQVWAVLKDRGLAQSAYYQVSTATRISYSLQYLLLVLALLALSFEVHEKLQPRF